MKPNVPAVVGTIALRILTVLAVSAMLGFALAEPAHAYLDPGTGSFIFQLIIAGILGALFLFKAYWKKLVTALRKLIPRNHKSDDDQTNDE